MNCTAISPDFVSLKARLKKTWMAGDYDRFSRYMESGARDFYERLDVAPGSQLLDVACGSGSLALIAARDGVKVTGVDIAGNLIERARERARAESLPATFEEADAEALPFEGASFEVVVSLIGAMFAPRPDYVAQELLRVCSPGALSPWRTGLHRGSSGRCSRPYRNSSHPLECPRHSSGATKRPFANASERDCRI